MLEDRTVPMRVWAAKEGDDQEGRHALVKLGVATTGGSSCLRVCFWGLR